ncbi:hypothetical protein [Sphingomonas sp. MS122]|uniref:hypothetical protein n=1 Tax=Sphingomonas sp. MS122 TaxID=3412683 RepID=UPI003C2B97EE
MDIDIKKLVDGVVGIGKAVAIIDPRIAGAIAAAEKVVEVVKDLRETATLDDDDILKLEESRAELEARIAENVDRVANKIAD